MGNSETELENGSESVGTLEKVGTFIDGFRLWVTRGWRIALLMGKGAYIVGERRRLFVRLGEEVFTKMQGGLLRDPDLEPLVEQLEKLTRKVEIEETMIRSIRFGNQTLTGRPLADNESKES